jgi:hypothetical protein
MQIAPYDKKKGEELCLLIGVFFLLGIKTPRANVRNREAKKIF